MSIEKRKFGELNGKDIYSYTLKNRSSASATFIEFGARIQSLMIPDKKGNLLEMIIGHKNLEQYLSSGDFHGATVGRYANRIANAKFILDGKTYNIAENENGNTLHGGKIGFSHSVWKVKCSDNSDDSPSITFSLHSPDGDQGFPGNCDVTVSFTLTTDNAIVIDYTAVSDSKTCVNLTNHSFFNLNGGTSEDVLSTTLSINADYITEVNDSLIPTGKLLRIEGPCDFRKSKTIGQDIKSSDHMIKMVKGYDHNYVLNGAGMKKAAVAYSEKSGIMLTVFTDLPGMQLYTANDFPKGVYDRFGTELKGHHAFCLETQYFPDSPNHSNFPFEPVTPEKPLKTRTIYKFETK